MGQDSVDKAQLWTCLGAPQPLSDGERTCASFVQVSVKRSNYRIKFRDVFVTQKLK